MTTAGWTIYYNPKCGTCRKVLDALRAKKIEPAIVEYLKTPPSPAEIDRILKALKLEPKDIAREKEDVYEALKLGTTPRTRAQWLKILSENPILIQRPIVVGPRRAVVARPPKKVEDLF